MIKKVKNGNDLVKLNDNSLGQLEMMSAYLKSQIGEIGVNQPEEQHKGEIDEKEKPFSIFCILHVAG